MKIALIGATGFVGGPILNEALARGHEVTAIVRAKLAGLPQDAKVTPAKVDVLDSAALAKVLEGHDLVVSAFNPGHQTPGDAVYHQHVAGHRAIIDAIKASGVKRYLAVGGAGGLKTPQEVEFVDSSEFPPQYDIFKGGIRGTRALYYLLKDEPKLDWVFLAPSVSLMPGERTGVYRKGKDHVLYDDTGESRISLEDYAVAMLDEAEHPSHHRERFTVGY